MTRMEKVIENVLDAVTRIILLENVQNHRKTRLKRVGGSWSDRGEEDDEKAKDETFLVAQASNEEIRLSYNSKAYIILNKHTRKIEESLNVTFDETPPPSKTSPFVRIKRLHDVLGVTTAQVPFIKELGYTGKCDMLSEIHTDHMHQPWRTFAAVISRFISGKSTSLDRLRPSRAQILWGMFYQKNVNNIDLL
ncbi:hypothetical protein Tco_0436637 [Tanacetum coccineum]